MKKGIEKCLSIILFLTLVFFSTLKTFSQELQPLIRANFSEGKTMLFGAAVDNKVYFGGGRLCSGSFTSKVEVYDVESHTWDEMAYYLSVPRVVNPVVCGKKIFFGGGISSFVPFDMVDVVDIIDTEKGIITTAKLSVPRLAYGVANDSIVIFAGGFLKGGETMSDAVDLYNVNTNEWTTAQLSEARDAAAGVVIGDLAIFAGGETDKDVSNKIDIYNFATDTWSIDSLSVARGQIAATVVGNKALFAGGMTSDGNPSDIVDVFNYEDGNGFWTTDHLSFPRAFLGSPSAGTACGRAIFVNGGSISVEYNFWTDVYEVVDIYYDNKWFSTQIPNHKMDHTVVGVDTFLIVAAGGPCGSRVDIYGCSQIPPVNTSNNEKNTG